MVFSQGAIVKGFPRVDFAGCAIKLIRPPQPDIGHRAYNHADTMAETLTSIETITKARSVLGT